MDFTISGHQTIDLERGKSELDRMRLESKELPEDPFLVLPKNSGSSREIKVVNVPDPAIIGNAIGTMLPEVSPSSDLKSSIFKIISNAKRKITKAPANAKEAISIPIKLSNRSPTNRNKIIINPETRVAFSDWICPILDLKPIIIGMEPKISITAKRVSVTVSISPKFIIISFMLLIQC